jgi:putative salt-induced outer membrane protein YdiY
MKGKSSAIGSLRRAVDGAVIGIAAAVAASAVPADAARAQATVKEDGQWRSSIGAAFSRATGNTRAASLAVQADTVRATEWNKWTAYTNLLYAETNDNRTAEQGRLGTRYDWKLTRQMFIFGGLDLERDEVALLDLRSTVSTGAGYRLFDRPDLTWEYFGGVGYVRDRYAEPRLVDEELRDRYGYATLLFGQESNHRFTDTTTAKQRLAIFPNLQASGEYRAQWDASIAVAMTRSWNLTAGVSWRYNSDPGPLLRKTDTLLTSGVSVKFD